MIELPLVFLGGLLGSAHCAGMCGGFAIRIGLDSNGLRSNLTRQLIYSAGRVFTYSFFGLVAGYTGMWVAARAHLWINAQAILCMIAGAFLTTQGLHALGLLPRPNLLKTAGGPAGCLAGTFVGPFLASREWSGVLLAGVLTGFLPCGLLYGFLALASSSASIWTGLLTMSVFGAGTAPLMMLTGTGGTLISRWARGRLLRISAICVCCTGLISIVRGIFFLQMWNGPGADVARCLLCGTTGGS
jgi:sulfite exporter TauE/SafE